MARTKKTKRFGRGEISEKKEEKDKTLQEIQNLDKATERYAAIRETICEGESSQETDTETSHSSDCEIVESESEEKEPGLSKMVNFFPTF